MLAPTRAHPHTNAAKMRRITHSAARGVSRKSGPIPNHYGCGLAVSSEYYTVELLETQISKCADFPLEVGQTGLPVVEARHRIALRRPRRLCARKGTRWLLGFPTVEKIRRRPARAYM